MASQPRKRSEPRTRRRLRQAVRAAVWLRFGDRSQFDPDCRTPSLRSIEREAMRFASWIPSITPKWKPTTYGVAAVAAWLYAMRHGALAVAREHFSANVDYGWPGPTVGPMLKPGTRMYGRVEFYNVWYVEAQAATWMERAYPARVRDDGTLAVTVAEPIRTDCKAPGSRVVYEVLKLAGMGPISPYDVAHRNLQKVVAKVGRALSEPKGARTQRAQRILYRYPLIAQHLHTSQKSRS